MRFRVLGPVVVERRSEGTVTAEGETLADDGWVGVRVPGQRERQALAMLLAPAGGIVTVDELLEALWHGRPPASAPRTLASHISRLRSVLDGPVRNGVQSAITSLGDAWRLDVDSSAVDAVRFESRARLTRDALDRGRHVEALLHAEAAAVEWCGVAYLGHTDLPKCSAEATRLTVLRDSLERDLVDAKLALGGARELLPDLESAVAANPLDERLWGQLMFAHYRTGDQVAALEDYRRARAALLEEVGVEPGPRLQKLHHDVLQTSASLATPGYLLTTRSARRGGCPFKGLGSYTEADAGFFLGRDRVLAKTLGHLAQSGLVCVTGPSGNGKSSLLLAGVVPAIRSGGVPGSEAWAIRVLTPTGSPAQRLEQAGPRHGDELLVVDQFEELFTLCTDASERIRFVDALLERVAAASRLAIGLRSDYWADLGFHSVLAERAVAATVFLKPLEPEDLRLVVREGARRTGLTAQDDLVEAVVSDAAGEPGILPHLSTALVATWERRDGACLTLSGYESGGRIAGALAQTAERLHAGATPGQQEWMRRLLLRLAVDEGSARVTRRRLDAADLVGDDPDAAAALDVLVSGRLLVAGDEGVQVAHEAVFTGWPRLTGWLQADAEARRVRAMTEDLAAQWAFAGGLDTDLMRGPRLVGALDLLDAEVELLSHPGREFLRASRAAAEDEGERARALAAEERRTGRRLRMLLAGVVTLLVLALVAGGLALGSRQSASRSRIEAVAARLGAQALVERRVDLAVLLAAQAVKLAPSSQTELALLSMLQRLPRALTMRTMNARIISMDLSPDGEHLAVSSNLGSLWVLDPDTLQVERQLTVGTGPAINGLTFLGDSAHLVYGIHRGEVTGVDLVSHDAATGITQPVGRVEDSWRVDASPDAGMIIVTSTLARAVLRKDGSTYHVEHLPFGANPTNFTADGRRFAVHDELKHELVIRDGATGAPLRTFTNIPGGVSTRLSPDGSVLAVADDSDGTIDLINTTDGRSQGRLVGHHSFVEDLDFSADGTLLASAGDDGNVIVWDVARRAARSTNDAGEEVIGVAFSPDGTVVTTASMDGSIVRWDTTNEAGFASVAALTLGPAQSEWNQVQYAGPFLAVAPRDGSLVVVADKGLTVHEPRALRVRRTLPLGAAASSVAMASRGDRVAAALVDGTVRILDTATWSESRTIEGVNPYSVVAWSRDGERVIVGQPDSKTLSVFDASTGDLVWATQLTGAPRQIAQHAGLIAVGVYPATVAIVSEERGEIGHTLRIAGSEQLYPVVAFASDGTLVVGNRAGSLQRFDVVDGSPIGDPQHVQPASVITQLVTIPDGRVVVGGGVAALVVDPLAPSASPAKLYGMTASHLAVDPRRDRLFVWDTLRSQVGAWDLDPAGWLEHACDIVEGGLSRSDWERLVGDIDYNPAC